MSDSGKGRGRTRIALVGAVVASIAAGAWVMFQRSSATFSDHPQAKKIAFARWNGNVLIKYDHCRDDLTPYVDAWEVIGDDLHEWEVHAHDEASWITGRHAVGDEGSVEPGRGEYEGSLPPASEIRMNVHVYSASYENRWHVRVKDLPLQDLPDSSTVPREVMSAEGETMPETRWRAEAKREC